MRHSRKANSIMEKSRSIIGYKPCSDGRTKRRSVEDKEKGKTSAASRFMSNVTEAMLHEILLRVPDSMSAIRCSSVCKAWLSVVTHEKFVAAFDRRHSDTTHFTFFCTTRFSSSIHLELSFPASKTIAPNYPTPERINANSCLDFLPWPRRKPTVMASCGGFLLLSFTDTEFCVCNPLTKQLRFLPPAPDNGGYELAGLILWPNDDDDSDDDHITFQVVLAVTNSVYFEAQVFCSESREWTERQASFPRWVFCDATLPSVASHGVLYWLVLVEYQGVVAYDPLTEACRYIDLPSVELAADEWIENVRLGLVRGRPRLGLVFRIGKALSGALVMGLRVWELSDRGADDDGAAEWCVVHNVRLRLRSGSRGACVIGFHPEDGDVVFLCCYPSGVCRYDIARDALEKVGQLRGFCGEQEMPQVFSLTVTLAYPSSWPKLIPRLREKRNPEIRAQRKMLKLLRREKLNRED